MYKPEVNIIEKKIFVLIGNYGSGKTELALNLGIQAAQRQQKTLLIDLDIVNPYFRSTEKAALLKENQIELISPPLALTAVDVPALSAEVTKAFYNPYDTVIFDVGGDPVGSAALGRYNREFTQFQHQTQVYYVMNTMRPLTASVEANEMMLYNIEKRSRLAVTGLVNNANLARETSVQNLIDGQGIIEKLAEKLNKPIRYISGYQKILERFAALKVNSSGELLPIKTYMRPLWLDIEQNEGKITGNK